MARKAVVRGPLLSSVVMVALASAATGLLAIIGFQALPESVVPSTFGVGEHETRNVDVSESPTSVLATRKPSASAKPTASPTATGTEGGSYTQYPVRTATRSSTTAPATTAPRTTATTTTAPRKTTSPKPTVSPTPTKAPTPTASPSPCRPKKKCGKSYSSYDSTSDRTYSSTATTSSSTETTRTKSKAAKSRGQKPHDRRTR